MPSRAVAHLRPKEPHLFNATSTIDTPSLSLRTLTGRNLEADRQAMVGTTGSQASSQWRPQCHRAGIRWARLKDNSGLKQLLLTANLIAVG